MINPMDLTGKHILITGASSGIGRQCAIQASRLGARITMIARNEERLRETVNMMERPVDHAFYPFDLLDTGGIEALVRRIVTDRGSVDGFCHSAGIGGMGRVVKMSNPEYTEKMFRIHEFAFIELVRCLGKRGNLNNGASLVGISSIAANNGTVSQGVYAAAKAAMNGFIRPAALEYASRGIRVNTVAYAMVDTEMYQAFLQSGGDEKVIQNQALGLIDAESAANAVMFLFSNACPFITGSVISVYAGA